MSKLSNLLQSLLSEDIKLDIDIDDVILTGKFKNKRTIVKKVGKDALGQPTINGKPILKFRIEKTLPKSKQSKQTREEKKKSVKKESKNLFIENLTNQILNKLIIETPESFKSQFYTDNTGKWRISDIVKWVKDNKLSVVSLPIKALVADNLKTPYYDNDFDESTYSADFIERAEKANTSIPIVVFDYPDGMFVADGLDRLWKANKDREGKIKAYFIDSNSLQEIPHDTDIATLTDI
jgi:hypothetical protein